MQQQQHPVFLKYTRKWLSEATGYSQGHLCHIATGRVALARTFIERVCLKLNHPESELFLPDTPAEGDSPLNPPGGA